MPNLCLEKGYLQMNPFLDLDKNISTIILDVKQIYLLVDYTGIFIIWKDAKKFRIPSAKKMEKL